MQDPNYEQNKLKAMEQENQEKLNREKQSRAWPNRKARRAFKAKMRGK